MNTFHDSPRTGIGNIRISYSKWVKIFSLALLAVFTSQVLNAQAQNLCAPDFNVVAACGDAISVEVFGASANGNITTDVAITIDTSLIDSMFVEVITKAPNDVEFFPALITTSAGDSCVIDPVTIENLGSAEMAASYRTIVNPASQVTVTVVPEEAEYLQSVVVFAVLSDQDCNQIESQFRGLLIYHACDTLRWSSSYETAQPRDVRLTIPISELGDGEGGGADRPAILDFRFYDDGMVVNNWIDTLT